MASTATPHDSTDDMSAADYLAPTEAKREAKKAEGPAPVRTNNHWEEIHGEYLPDADLLDEGDDVYITYRERLDRGGLRYSPSRMAITGRITEVSGDLMEIDVDLTDTPAVLRLNNHSDGRPTVVFPNNTYGVQHLVRRTDTTPERRKVVKAVEFLTGKGYDVEEDGGISSKSWKGRATVTTPEEYEYVVAFLNEIGAEISFSWYESEEDLRGEEGFKSKAAVENYEFVWITFQFTSSE